jgi:uncharacterized protein (DUF433 family)
MTELRDCFDLLPESGALRLKGTRIDWEHVVQLFQVGRSPEEILATYGHVLRLEEVYAAITYYLLNRTEYEEYVRRGDEYARQAFEKYWQSLTPEQQAKQTAMRNRLRELKTRFTDERGRLDIEALKQHVAAEKTQAAATGS